jgi:hypothetical protein
MNGEENATMHFLSGLLWTGSQKGIERRFLKCPVFSNFTWLE